MMPRPPLPLMIRDQFTLLKWLKLLSVPPSKRFQAMNKKKNWAMLLRDHRLVLALANNRGLGGWRL